MQPKVIIILGAGVGGLVAAHRLRKSLGSQHRIVLVDRNPTFAFAPSFLWVLTGKRNPNRITRNFSKLKHKGIEFVPAEVTKLDLANRSVYAGTKAFQYDYLIIALGALPTPTLLPGLSETLGEGKESTGFNLYDLTGVTRLRDSLASFSGGRIVILISGLPFKCPAAPYEAGLLIDAFLKKRGLRHKSEVAIYTPEGLPLPAAGTELGNQVKQLLAVRQIQYFPNQKVQRVVPETRDLYFESGAKEPFDLLVVIPPHTSATCLKGSGLVGDTLWIPVDRHTLKTRFQGVYAIGDTTAIPIGSGLMLPKAGVFAERQAEVVANNIAAEITGSGALKKFDGYGACFLEIGYGKAGYASGYFYTEPRPQVSLRAPGFRWHWGKILFEKRWLSKWS